MKREFLSLDFPVSCSNAATSTIPASALSFFANTTAKSLTCCVCHQVSSSMCFFANCSTAFICCFVIVIFSTLQMHLPPELIYFPASVKHSASAQQACPCFFLQELKCAAIPRGSRELCRYPSNNSPAE